MAQCKISCSLKLAGWGTSRSSRIIFSWLLLSKDQTIDHTCIFTLRIKSLFLHQTSRVNVCMQLHAYQWRPSLSPNSHESSSQAATAPLEKFYLCVVLINTQGLGFCWQYLLMKQNLETSTWNPLLHAEPELIWLGQLAVGANWCNPSYIVSLKIDAVPIMGLHLLSVMTLFCHSPYHSPHSTFNIETLLHLWEIYLSATEGD